MPSAPLSLVAVRKDFAASMLAEFAQTNHLKLRGHTLVRHTQLPWWLTHGQWTRDESLRIMGEHITTVMRHFKGKVYAWDVVNEALSDQAPWGVRPDSFWSKMVGPELSGIGGFLLRMAEDPGKHEKTADVYWS